jgi:hypothetical protein
MINRLLTAALMSTTLLAGNSFAADAMTLSREQVRAAYQQAKTAGTILPAGEVSAPELRQLSSVRSRDEVRAELALAQKNGTLTRGGEAGVLFTAPASAVAPRERQQVRAEAVVFAHQSHAMKMMD